ncbi:sigma factor-like helix-turn-helix DNA-binding protein [Neobacillus rhizosphaerae]|uniref:sigma factor-like helix-turn-helix DNA-binding protein n=1 Tax=Neobacillus rhizosphaerae TaxID=2880965 RepID=UPI003D2BBA6B
MAHSDFTAMERLLSTRYPITKIFGVTNVLKDIHTLREQRFQGTDTTLLSCILIDFERLMEKARLTERQKQALFYHYELDLTQQEVAEVMNVSQQAVSKHIDNAIAKIVIVAKEEESKA